MKKTENRDEFLGFDNDFLLALVASNFVLKF